MYSEDIENTGAQERNGDDVFSKPVRAGKRTYFFDVKATKGNDYYLTITESKRRVEKDGRFVYDKHKIFLYKEDFDKFAQGLDEVVAYIKERCPVVERVPEEGQSYQQSAQSDYQSSYQPTPTSKPAQSSDSSFSDVKFEEL